MMRCVSPFCKQASFQINFGTVEIIVRHAQKQQMALLKVFLIYIYTHRKVVVLFCHKVVGTHHNWLHVVWASTTLWYQPGCGIIPQPVCGIIPQPVCGIIPQPVCGIIPQPVCGIIPQPVCGIIPQPVCGTDPQPVVAPRHNHLWHRSTTSCTVYPQLLWRHSSTNCDVFPQLLWCHSSTNIVLYILNCCAIPSLVVMYILNCCGAIFQLLHSWKPSVPTIVNFCRIEPILRCLFIIMTL